MKNKTCVVLVNVGTPDQPEVKNVRSYLNEFLNDGRIIEIPALFRKILVSGIIVPFRSRKSAKLYKKIWTPEGSPLMVYSQSFANKLQAKLGEQFIVKLAMRYQNPNFENIMKEVKAQNPDKITLFPLFPQYSSATTGSTIERFFQLIRNWNTFPEIKIINSFYSNIQYINSFEEKIKKHKLTDYDHVLFSFHGLPNKQVFKAHSDTDCANFNCTTSINADNHLCYHAQCYETTKLLAEKLNLKKSSYTVCFQSRFTNKWLAPFADETIVKLAHSGNKRLLVICPSFVADCLETIHEIGSEYNELFLKHGGEVLTLVESLNDSELWIEAARSLID